MKALLSAVLMPNINPDTWVTASKEVTIAIIPTAGMTFRGNGWKAEVKWVEYGLEEEDLIIGLGEVRPYPTPHDERGYSPRKLVAEHLVAALTKDGFYRVKDY